MDKIENQNSGEIRRLLLIVDPQIDFISGSLVVPGADAAMKRIGDYLCENGARYSDVIITADWHPANHSSFAEHGGQWPAHCVQYSVGAAISDDVLQPAIKHCPTLLVMTKGDDTRVDEYSIFANPVSGKAIRDLMDEKGLEGIDICGIAGDVCVLNTAKDAVAIYGHEKVRVLEELCASLDDGTTLKNFIETNHLQ